MPYTLRGNSVVKKGTGKLVKRHPTRAKALAHLKALNANVEKSAIDRTIIVLKGAPVGNRNAAKDYSPQQQQMPAGRVKKVVEASRKPLAPKKPSLFQRFRGLLYKRRDVTPEEAAHIARQARLRSWGF
jgi:hypothetical protein